MKPLPKPLPCPEEGARNPICFGRNDCSTWQLSTCQQQTACYKQYKDARKLNKRVKR